MGGTGIAYHNDASAPFFINLKNPASYAYNFIPLEDSSGHLGLKMAAFEAGILDDMEGITTQGQTVRGNNAYLAYVALNIPVSRHVGIAMGLTPVSTEGYDITTNNNIDSNNVPGHTETAVQNTYSAAGGIDKVFVGAAYAPWKNFSIGANLSFLFGNLTNEEEIFFPPNNSAFNTVKTENVGIHSFDGDFGIMYTQKIAGDWSVTIGATVAPALYLNADYSIFTVAQNNLTGSTVDTLQDSASIGKIKIPLTYGVGLTFKKGDRWTFSFDRTGQNWSQYSYFGQNQNLTDSYIWSAGAQYVPKKNFPKSYAQRIQYRIGFSYGQSYLDLYNTPLIQKSFSAGIGFPVGPSNSLDHPAMLNIGIQIGSMGTTTNNLILQNYFKVMFAITFNDHWFDKRMFQ